MAFVSARNIERRHLNPGQRSQIVLSVNKRFGHGGDRSKVSNDTLKTHEELAEEAKVSVATIKRASQVENLGRADEVISGEKSAGEVLKEEKEKALTTARENMKSSEKMMWQALWDIKRVHAQNFITAACEAHPQWGVDNFPKDAYATDTPDIWHTRYNVIHTEIQNGSEWVSDFIGGPHSEPGSPKLEIKSDSEVGSDGRAFAGLQPADGNGSAHRRRNEQNPRPSAEDVPDSDQEPVELVIDTTPDTDDNPDYEHLQQEHVKRLKELPGEIREYIPKWINANPIRAEAFGEHANKITLKLLLNARSELKHGIARGDSPFFREEMEDLLERLKGNDGELVDKVREALGVSTKSSEVNSLEAVAESLTEAIDAVVERAGIEGDAQLMPILEKAAVHYSFGFQEFLYVTYMYDSADEKQAWAYTNNLTPAQVAHWKDTFYSMKRDIENGENWAKAFATTTGIFEDETDSDKFLIEGIDIHFRREDAEGNRVSNAGIECLSFSDDDHTGLYSHDDLGDLPDEVIRGIEDFLKSHFKEQNEG